MSNKKQPYINKPPPIEPGTAPPRYQPPPQVNSGIGILKHCQNKNIQQKVNLGIPPSKEKVFQIAVTDSVNVKSYHQENSGNYIPPPPQTDLQKPYSISHYPPQTVIQNNNRIINQSTLGLPQRVNDENILRLSQEEMLKFVRKAEGDHARVTSEQNREATRRIQSYAAELRSLKEANQRLGDDNQELRDLCCFLDDDRQKGRKLAREWQRFGRYTASVMRQEVSAYQNKLRELDNKQQELIKDNLELKELCLYLDEERNQNIICPSCGNGLRPGQRDDGDGSSSSTNADEPNVPSQFGVSNQRRVERRDRIMEESIQRQRTVFNDQMMLYVRSLEQRVKQLEEENLALQQKLGSTENNWESVVGGGRPEAVVRALQVLEVREQLERGLEPLEAITNSNSDLDMATPDMDDGEKALVREMCNVVWRKLEEEPSSRR